MLAELVNNNQILFTELQNCESYTYTYTKFWDWMHGYDDAIATLSQQYD